jgi:surface antigen
MRKVYANFGKHGKGIIGAAIAASTGVVKGTATTSTGSIQGTVNEMSWSDRFDEQRAIQKRLAEAEDDLRSIPEQREEAIRTVDENIAYWEAKRTEMEKQANNPLNKIPTNLKGDSASDIYKEEIQRCDDILASLNERKTLYESDAYWDGKRGEIESRISDLNMQQTELDGVIQQGIKSDGPTTGISLAGCAKYVSEKRDLSDIMIPGESNACQWDDNAIKAGYEVGDRPIPGSVMVIEPKNEFMKVDSIAGHVVYIEKVTPVEGGYKITYSQASTPRDSAGNWNGEYSYTNVTTSTKIVADGTPGISFIYEKPPK